MIAASASLVVVALAGVAVTRGLFEVPPATSGK